MKKNNTIFEQGLKDYFRYLASLFFVLLINTISSQSLVINTFFHDDFEGGNLLGGSPGTTYSIVKVVGVGADPIDPNTTSTAGTLRIPNRKETGAYGRNIIVGGLSHISSPYTSKLSDLDVDSIAWTFNMRQNYEWAMDGFNDIQKGLAVIFLASGSDFSSASGYAIVNGNNGTDAERYRYRLVKFTGGLFNNNNITTIANGQTFADRQVNRSYMSIRVVFIPESNTWRFYDRIDGPNSGGSFADPDSGIFDHIATGVDNTHINTDMTHFGFMLNYSGNVDLITWYDNFKIKTYQTDFGTRASTLHTNEFIETTTQGNTVFIESKNSKIYLYDNKGSLINQLYINGSSSISIKNKGLYILRAISPEGEIKNKKFLIQ